MKLTIENTYIVGVHVMFYEIEMLPEYIDSCIGMIHDINNKENITFHFTWNTSEYFERIDMSIISIQELNNRFYQQVDRIERIGCKLIVDIKDNLSNPYNIADYRRDLNYNYCTTYDFVLWGETDSLWPKECLQIIESVDRQAKSQGIFKYVLYFSDRKMWDVSWQVIEHNDFTNVKFIDDDVWPLENEASSKAYMSLERMYEINSKVDDVDIRILQTPKFDGSCLVIKSDLIKSGVNIPQSLLCSGEDTSFAELAKLILGDQFIQFVIKNILHVHNRRHPNKRLYILNENNPRGFCGKEKGNWWQVLQTMSKQNLNTLRTQSSTFSMQDVINKIKE